MRTFAVGRSPEIGRRAFLGIAAAAGVGFLVPGLLSCGADSVLKPGDTPPTFTLECLKRNPVAVPSDFRGRVALIHFWAAWCPYCRAEMTALESLFGEYGQKALIPCSINLGDGREAAEEYTKGLNLSYPVLLDPKLSLRRAYGISGVPTTFLLDRDNVIRYRIIGEINRKGLDGLIRTLL